MKNRVRIGTCSGPAEAAFVRSVFDAHELPVVINGEMHASAMGGLAGFVRLDILVDHDDSEEALALLRDIRAGEHAVSEGDEFPDDPDDPGGDERADAAGVWNATRPSEAAGAPAAGPADPAAAVATPAATGAAAATPAPAAAMAFVPTTGFDTRRRRTGAVLLLSVLLGFGTAHMSTGAWGRGVAIAALNVAGFAYVAIGQASLGGWLLFGARFADMFGALWRVWSRPDGDRKRPDTA
jgi:Putative prokaryotic signal transducing protein